MRASLSTRILLAFNVVLYLSWVDRYFFALGISPVRPFYWYLFTIASGAMAILLAWDVALPRLPAKRLLMWSGAYAAASILFFVGSSQGPIAIQALITNIEAAALLAVFIMQLRNEGVARATCTVVLLVALWGSFVNVVEFFRLFPLPLSLSPGRVAGFYQNPNISGTFLVAAMVIGAWALPKYLRWWFCIIVGVAVFLTFSRASLLQWAVAVVGLAWAGKFALPRRASLAVVGVVVLVVGAAMVAGRATGVFDALGVGERLTDETSARITGSVFGQQDLSTRSRLALARSSIDLFREAPLVGHGLASTYEWRSGGGTHNMFLMFAVEMGVLGLILFASLIWMLWSTGSAMGRIMAVVFTTSSMFSHNNLEYPAMMIVLAIAASISDDGVRESMGYPTRRSSQYIRPNVAWRPRIKSP